MLPTPHGLIFCLALFAMLLIAVNYNNGLAYAFVFLIGAIAAVSMLFTHRNLSGLEIHATDAEPVFADETARFPVLMVNRAAYRRDSLWLISGPYRSKYDVPAISTVQSFLHSETQNRGYMPVPKFRLASAFPFGLLYTWSAAIPAEGAKVLVYPKANGNLPLPRDQSQRFEDGTKTIEGDDFIGLREYQPSDPPRHIHWKAVARDQGGDQKWLTKQFGGGQNEQLWLKWEHTIGDTESRLSQLCRWVCDAEALGLDYGLQMPGQSTELAKGGAHRHRCLSILALWGIDSVAVS